jgi:hypothetical protein
MKQLQSLGRCLGWCAAALLATASAKAGPLEELKSLSQLPGIDLAKLKGGEILTQRGPEGNFARGISAASCYFVHASIAVVGEQLLHWDPTKHPRSDSRLYREYGFPSPRVAFQTLRLDQSIPNDRWLLDHTLGIADGVAADNLHLTAAEVKLIRQDVPKKGAASPQARVARANDVWGEILRRRSDSLGRGGIAAVAPYDSNLSISPGSELRGLLTLNAAAAKHFRPVLNAKPLTASGASADEAVGYWETTIVRGHTTLQLGLFSARKSAISWQLADCVYYPTDTYFMALDVYQLWPVDGGTLVWQVSFVSAPFRTYLGGVDRYIAGKQLTQETLDTIKTFRAAVERR